MGFFYLENHGVPEEVMRQVFEQSKAFFSLSIEDKLSVRTDKNNRGYTPMHEEILDPANQAKGDTKVTSICRREGAYSVFFCVHLFGYCSSVTMLASFHRVLQWCR